MVLEVSYFVCMSLPLHERLSSISVTLFIGCNFQYVTLFAKLGNSIEHHNTSSQYVQGFLSFCLIILIFLKGKIDENI